MHDTEMDGLPREKINMAKNLTDMIKGESHCIIGESTPAKVFPAQMRVLYTDTKSNSYGIYLDFEVVHYKMNDDHVALAVGYAGERSQRYSKILMHTRATGGVIDALERLWSLTQNEMSHKFRKGIEYL